MTYLGLAVICILSILVSRHLQISSAIWCYLLSVVVALCWLKYRWRSGAAILILASLGLMLAGRVAQLPEIDQDQMVSLDGQSITITGVAQQPKVSDKSVTVILDQVTIELSDGQQLAAPAVMGILPIYTPISYGDQVKLVGKFQAAVSEEDGFGIYLLNHQIVGSVIYPKVEVLAHGQGNRLVAASWQAGRSIEARVIKLLPQDEAGLLLGIVLGLPTAISQTAEDAFKATGITHIVVASGYNVSILVALAAKSKSRVGNSGSVIIAIIIIYCYALMSGASPSIIRAGLMAGITFAAVSFGRQKQTVRFLAIVGVGMLLVNPLWLLDTSFQLSFGATLGILLFQAALQRKLSDWPEWIATSLSTTMAAQILVIPILICTFGTISLISLLTNVLVLWALPLIMALGFAVIVASFLFQILAQLIAMLVHPLLWYIIYLATWLSHWPLTSVSLELGWGWAIPYYLAVIIIYRWRHLRLEDQIEVKASAYVG